jgi:hypothetical protein
MKILILVLASTLVFLNSVFATNIYENSNKIQINIEKSIELQFEMATDREADKNAENSVEYYSYGLVNSCSKIGSSYNSNTIGNL